MYKVIGSDNREYGPASEEVIRRWIAEGRANGATQVQKEGETSWRPLSSCVEFAEALAAGSLTPPVAVPEAPASAPSASAAPSAGPGPSPTPGFGPDPTAAAAAASALESELLSRDANLDIGACVQRSWELFQKNPWLVAGA